VNVPEPWNGGVKFTRQSQKITRNQLSEGKDPRGRSYFWLFEQRIDKDVEPDTITRRFFPERLHHSAAPRPHARRIAQSSFSLGRADRRGFVG